MFSAGLHRYGTGGEPMSPQEKNVNFHDKECEKILRDMDPNYKNINNYNLQE